MHCLIILGPPGSGKGTQANLISEKFDFYHLETSKILEENFKRFQKKEWIKIAGKKYFISKEKDNWKKGFLVSPPLVSFWVKEKIKTIIKENKSLILSGSPRSLEEGRKLMPLLKKFKKIIMIELLLSPEDSIYRNSHRRICELARHSIIYSKETAKLEKCPLDGSKLIKRKGLDEPETIKKRLKEYKKMTKPVINYLKKQGFKIKKINAGRSIAEVFKEITAIILS